MRWTSLAVCFLTPALAGCLGASPDGTSDSSDDSSPTTVYDAASEAYNETVAYQLNAAATAPSFTVSKSWAQLSFRSRIVLSAPCGQISNDPDGSPPSVTLASPSGASVTLNVPAGTNCDSNNSQFGIASDTADAEKGQWTVTVKGRGQGASVEIIVRGS